MTSSFEREDFANHETLKTLKTLFAQALVIVRNAQCLPVSYPVSAALDDIEKGLQDLEPNYKALEERLDEFHRQQSWLAGFRLNDDFIG